MNPSNGRCGPISWSVERQGPTSNSSAEAETVALCDAVTHERLPASIVLNELLASARRPVELVGELDCTHAITAVHKG